MVQATRRLASRSVLRSVYSTAPPSGESCASPTPLIAAKSAKVIGRFCCCASAGAATSASSARPATNLVEMVITFPGGSGPRPSRTRTRPASRRARRGDVVLDRPRGRASVCCPATSNARRWRKAPARRGSAGCARAGAACRTGSSNGRLRSSWSSPAGRPMCRAPLSEARPMTPGEQELFPDSPYSTWTTTESRSPFGVQATIRCAPDTRRKRPVVVGRPSMDHDTSASAPRARSATVA